jgi:hypothetical protein
MLGKKELVVILVVLICVAVYLYLEYVYNQRDIEGFTTSTMDKQRKVDEMKKINQDIFKFYETFLDNDILFYKHDIGFVNYIIQKKFNLKNFLTKPKIVDGNRQNLKNPKLVRLLDSRKTYLDNIVNNLGFSLSEIENLKTNHSINNKFYDSYKIILTEMKNIYEDKLSYLVDGNSNFFNLDGVIEDYNIIKSKTDTREPLLVNNLNDYLKASKNKFKTSAENIEKEINDLLYFIDISTDIDKNIRGPVRLLFKTRLNVLAKIVLRDMTFEILDEIVLSVISASIGYSDKVVAEKTDAAKKSNKIVTDLIENLYKEINITKDVLNFFNTNKMGMILLSDSEFKYFNSVNTNTQMLQNFCRKVKKIDRPNNSKLLFKRLSKEYIVKKNNQIDKLNNQINKVMGEMTFNEAYNTNLHNLRTSDEAEKQMNAIKIAKENIDSIGKFNLNLK